MYYHKIIIIFTKLIIFYKMSIKQHKHNQTNNIRIKCEKMMWEFLGQICYKARLSVQFSVFPFKKNIVCTCASFA